MLKKMKAIRLQAPKGELKVILYDALNGSDWQHLFKLTIHGF